MATRAKRGSRGGVEWRTDAKGVTRWRGVLNTKATGKVNGPWCTSQAEAKTWRVKALGEAQAGKLRKGDGRTLREAWETFIAGAEAGTITDRTGKTYSASTLDGYKRAWERIDPDLGAHRLDRITREAVQALVDRWRDDGLKPATVRNSLDPLRTIYRRAIQRGQVAVNPTLNLDVARVDNRRERFATREEAAALIAALPVGERALWATAFYAGLRRSELRALRWSNVDLADGLIRVERAWNDGAKAEHRTKTKAAVRKVPIIPELAKLLKARKLATGRDGSDLVFGRTATEPFTPTTARSRALRAWKKANDATEKDLGRPLRESERLRPIGLHECRHTFASFMIAAGANAKALSVVMGHGSITITFDTYGKLMPGGEAEVGRLLGAYLDGKNGAEPLLKVTAD